MSDEAAHYMESTSAEKLAQRFHESYERLAPEFGYKTREASAVPWEQVPADNKALMVAVAIEVLGASRESTSRLRAENEELRERLRQAEERASDADADWHACMDRLAEAKGYEWKRVQDAYAENERERRLLVAAEATMREVAQQMHNLRGPAREATVHEWADRLDPPPVVEKKTCPHPKACWGEMVCLSVEGGGRLCDDARLSPPPVVEKPLHAYFPSDVNAGSRSPCMHCGQAYDAHVPPPVVEKP